MQKQVDKEVNDPQAGSEVIKQKKSQKTQAAKAFIYLLHACLTTFHCLQLLDPITQFPLQCPVVANKVEFPGDIFVKQSRWS